MTFPSSSDNLFASIFMGGFECAAHRRRDGLQLDVLAATGHAQRAAEDYALLQQAGIRTVRDGLRWHRIETAPRVYDWTSFLPMLAASHATGTQVIWDLCHWGIPAGLDIFSPAFIPRFAAFAGAAAEVIARNSPRRVAYPPLFCPINEISFWAWVGGDVKAFAPHREGQGPVLKRQLVSASLAAMQAVLKVLPGARFVQAEPLIHVSPGVSAEAEQPDRAEAVRRHNLAQYEAWDMLRGDLGGSPAALDLLGVNYYWDNQWQDNGERTPPGHPGHRPLHRMLVDLWQRYRRPIVLTETGAEAENACGWLGYVAAEVRLAQKAGVEILGVCLYPVMDYPGWDDDRHCACGLIEVDDAWRERHLRTDLADELHAQSTLFATHRHAVLLGESRSA
jgi:beta-glucosidase/6-phospho-beta-glucosidase/beta-galactosidase